MQQGFIQAQVQGAKDFIRNKIDELNKKCIDFVTSIKTNVQVLEGTF